MAWNKLRDGRLALLDDNGIWRDFAYHPLSNIYPEPFPEMSKGWSLYQALRKTGWILVHKEDY